MKTGRGWWALAGVVVVSLALLLGGYVGAYYAMVRPFMSPWGSSVEAIYVVPLRLREGTWLFFRPIHNVDRWLRPSVWSLDDAFQVDDPDLSPENSN